MFCGLCVHGIEKFVIRLGLTKLVEKEFDRVLGTHRIEDAAQNVHFLQVIAINQQFFFPRTGFENVDSREDALVGHFAVEDDFRVTRALEFLEDDFVPFSSRFRSGLWQ